MALKRSAELWWLFSCFSHYAKHYIPSFVPGKVPKRPQFYIMLMRSNGSSLILQKCRSSSLFRLDITFLFVSRDVGQVKEINSSFSWYSCCSVQPIIVRVHPTATNIFSTPVSKKTPGQSYPSNRLLRARPPIRRSSLESIRSRLGVFFSAMTLCVNEIGAMFGRYGEDQAYSRPTLVWTTMVHRTLFQHPTFT